ncbi:MAG: hypothetical protein AAGE13_03010 [Pseudomonadota bacterium]
MSVLGGRYEIRLSDGFARDAKGGFADVFVTGRFAEAYGWIFGAPPAGDIRSCRRANGHGSLSPPRPCR